MRWVLAGCLGTAVGCGGAGELYVVDTVFQDDCETGLGRGATLALVVDEDEPGVERVALEVPDLGLTLPCEVYDGHAEQVCARETEDGDLERWFWGRDEGALAAAVDRTSADGSSCITAMTARPWGHVEVEISEDDLEQAAWVAAFLAAPPEVQLGAAAFVGWWLTQMDLSVIGDASS